MTAVVAVLAASLQLDGTFSYQNKNKRWCWRPFSGQRCFCATPSWLWQDLVKPRGTFQFAAKQWRASTESLERFSPALVFFFFNELSFYSWTFPVGPSPKRYMVWICSPASFTAASTASLRHCSIRSQPFMLQGLFFESSCWHNHRHVPKSHL